MEFDNHARHWTYGGHDEHRGCTRSKGEEHTDFPAFGFADAVKSTGRQGDYLELALGLFTDEDRCELSERQLVVLGKLCKARQGGFHYRELPLVQQLLPLVERRVVKGDACEFRAVLLKLLDLCSLAPVRERANEEMTDQSLEVLNALFCVLGGFLRSPDCGIQCAAANVLRQVASGYAPARPHTPGERMRDFRENLRDLRPKPRDINQALLLTSGVVALAIDCLDTTVGALLEKLANYNESSLASSSFGDDESVDLGPMVRRVPNRRGIETPLLSEQDDIPVAGTELETGRERASGGNSVEVGHCAEETQQSQPDCDTAASGLNSSHHMLKSLLQFVCELSTNTASSAVMIEAGLISLLVQVLGTLRSIRDANLAVMVEVLWNCLEHSHIAMKQGLPAQSRTSLIRKARKSNATFVLSSWDGVFALRNTVESLIVCGFREKDKELRNETIIVASLLAKNGRSHPMFRKTGMLQLLLRYATAAQGGMEVSNSKTTLVEASSSMYTANERIACNRRFEGRGAAELGAMADPRNFATMTEVDIELKQLLWSLLAELSRKDPYNLEVIKASPLMETLLMYIDLVIEEGPLSPTSGQGVSRSVSLASVPMADTCRARLGLSGTATPCCDGDDNYGPNRNLDLAQDATLETLTPGDIISAGYRPVTDLSCAVTHSEDALSPGNIRASCSEKWNGESPTGGGIMDQNELGVHTQLELPMTGARLPVTSIKLLQSQAMGSLLVLAPRIPEKFQVLKGHVVTLRLLDRLGSHPENQKLVKAATKILATVVGLPGLKEELGQMDGVRIMLGKFTVEGTFMQQASPGAVGRGRGCALVQGGGEDDKELRTDIVVILCRLCEECLANQEAFRKADGIPKMMAAIKGYCRTRSELKQHEKGSGGMEVAHGGTSKRADSHTHSVRLESGSGHAGREAVDPTLVHVVDCIWCAVVGSRRSEARLLQCEGLDTLLDLLQLCPVVMRHQVTGVIADLLRNKRSIPYARAWRSDLGMISISQLAIRLWVEEEARLGVSRPNGVLQNLWQPLQSHDWASHRRPYPDIGRCASPRASCITSVVSEARSWRHNSTTGASPDGDHAGGGRNMVDPVPCGEDATDNIFSVASPAGKTVDSRRDSPESRLTVDEGRLQETGAQAPGRSRQIQAMIGFCRGGFRKIPDVSLEESLAKAVGHLDLRGKLAAVLGLVGFDVNAAEGLGPSELKAAYMATSYVDFLTGEAWQKVAAELEAQHINPIAADALVLDAMLEKAFDRAHDIKNKQTELTAEQGARDAETEAAFFASILFQRDQEIRQAIIKRNALMPGTSKNRPAIKKGKDAIIKSSNTELTEESGSAVKA